MIRRVVGQYHCITAPALPLAIQYRAQLLEEEAHGLGVVVALAQGIIDVSEGVEADGEGDPGRQLLLGLRVLLTYRTPRHPPVVRLVQPALVHVQDDLVLNVPPEEGVRPCLTFVDVEGRVDVQGLLPDPAELQLEVLFQHRDDEPLREFQVSLF